MKQYPLSDAPSNDEVTALGLTAERDAGSIVAVWAGEKRWPQAGEWYLSGAIPQAYKAPNNLRSSFPIAKLMVAE